MNKKICMYVWNHFTNDARVLRECTALSDAGYEVDLICIHDPSDKNLKKEEIIEGFRVKRVDRYPSYISIYQNIIRKFGKKKLILFGLIVLVLSYLINYKLTLGILGLGVILGLLKKLKFIKTLVIVNVFVQMIKEGLKKDYDIYHSNDLNTLPQGYLCAKVFRKKKLVYDSHEVQTSRTGYGNKKRYKYLESFLTKRIDKMIMTTNTRADYTKKLYPYIDDMKVIHNYPFYTPDMSDKEIDLYEILDIDKSKPILLYQGGIQEGRGLEKIVEAIPMFKDGIIVFIGDGKLKPRLINMVEERKLQDKVRFMNKVPVNDLKYYTKNAYLGFQVLQNVCFNHYSAISNKFFEYMMAEVPVVAVDFPEIKRIMDEHPVGVCIDASKPEEIAKGVNLLLEDKKYYETAKKECKIARDIYNWDKEKKKFVEIYDKL